MGGPTRTRRAAPLLLAAGAYALTALVAAACGSTSARYAGPDGPQRLYEARCGLCHVIYSPSDFTPAEWPPIVKSMSARSGLTRSQRERVIAYLVSAPRQD